MRLVLQIVAGILIATVLVFGGCTWLMYQGAKEIEAQNRKDAAELAKQAQAFADRFTQGLRLPATPSTPGMILVDVGTLTADQSCINGTVLFIDRSVPGGATARSFSENGRPVPCRDRTRQRWVPAPAAGGTRQ